MPLYENAKQRLGDSIDYTEISLVLEQEIHLVATLVDKFLLQTFRNDFAALTHLTAIKKYSLLADGHFSLILYQLCVKELSKPVSSIRPHNLSGMLEEAIRTSLPPSAPITEFVSSHLLPKLVGQTESMISAQV